MGKTVEEYLKLGLDRKYAEYFSSGRRIITDVRANDDFSLTLIFDNGEERLLSLKHILLPGTVFEPFLQLDNFKRVYLDDDHCVSWDIDPDLDSKIYWNNKVDLSPDSCYVDSVHVRYI